MSDTDLFLTKLGIDEYDFGKEPLDEGVIKDNNMEINSEEEAEH